jgi:trypsin-like peptidase
LSPGAKDGDGVEIPPGSGVIPILKDLGSRKFKVVGTGFYITRYGLFATAKHVLEELADVDKGELGAAYILEDDGKHLISRRIVHATLSTVADVALGQAENGDGEATGRANRRASLSLVCPVAGEGLITYAYPENEILDFTDPSKPQTLKADFFEGKFIRRVPPEEHPLVPYPHYETSMEIRSGASGSPVFCSGRITAVACRGWDFRGSEFEGQNLSNVLPVGYLLSLNDTCATTPRNTWEYARIPDLRKTSALSFGELVAYGHVDFGTF